jgi:hypothetical protein
VLLALPPLGWARFDADWAAPTLAVLGAAALVVAAQAREALVRQGAAATAAALGVTTTWAALAPSWEASDAALIAVLAMVWGVVAVVGLVRKDAPEGFVLEALGLVAMGLWVVGVLAEQHLAAPMVTVLACTVLAAALVTGRRVERMAAPLLGAAAVILWLGRAGIDVVESYSTVAAIGLFGAIAWTRERGASPLDREVLWLPLAVGLGVPVLYALAVDEQLRLVLSSLACVVVLGLGVQHRLRAPVELGGAGLVAVALDTLGPLATELPRWVALGIAGSLVLWMGATVERRMAQVRSFFDELSALR